jgi:hypothetical protein
MTHAEDDWSRKSLGVERSRKVSASSLCFLNENRLNYYSARINEVFEIK